MRLMGGLNWWAPAPLHRLWERLGLGNLEGGPPEPEPVREPLPVEQKPVAKPAPVDAEART